ncbi:MAG: FAD:protein FMN transferase [Crocinitomicaceae bacterium]
MKIFPGLLMILFLSACVDQPEDPGTHKTTTDIIEYYGNTQGTTFSVIINDDIELKQEEIEAMLAQFDQALSGYIPNSIISKLNNAPAGLFSYQDEFGYFNACYELSKEMYQLTNGAFDPTVYPLVDGWGFMQDIENVPDSSAIDSLRALVGFKKGQHFDFKYTIDEGDTLPASQIYKRTPQAKLDFNAIAQGYAVDVLAEMIEEKGAENYFVEIGGEIRVKGKNAEGDYWRIGIDKPIEHSTAETRQLQEVVRLNNKSIATSGSYRKFYEKDGIKYSHTLDPTTGYPVTHSLLSATVVADDCAIADALATALMVMGPDKGMQFIKNHSDLDVEVYLIFNNDKGRMETFYTKDFRDMLIE